MDTSGYLASPWSGGSCFFCQLQKAFKRSPESATIFKSDCFIKKKIHWLKATNSVRP